MTKRAVQEEKEKSKVGIDGKTNNVSKIERSNFTILSMARLQFTSL